MTNIYDSYGETPTDSIPNPWVLVWYCKIMMTFIYLIDTDTELHSIVVLVWMNLSCSLISIDTNYTYIPQMLQHTGPENLRLLIMGTTTLNTFYIETWVSCGNLVSCCEKARVPRSTGLRCGGSFVHSYIYHSVNSASLILRPMQPWSCRAELSLTFNAQTYVKVHVLVETVPATSSTYFYVRSTQYTYVFIKLKVEIAIKH